VYALYQAVNNIATFITHRAPPWPL